MTQVPHVGICGIPYTFKDLIKDLNKVLLVLSYEIITINLIKINFLEGSLLEWTIELKEGWDLPCLKEAVPGQVLGSQKQGFMVPRALSLI